MRRIRLTIAYDGTGFRGYQQQPGLRTVEGVLNEALSELTGAPVAVIGASRTDSGVHALGNRVVFDTESSIPAEKYPLAAAKYLPGDLRVTAGDEVPAGWHPRHADCLKTYEYSWQCGEAENPLLSRYMSWVRRSPDTEAMREAANYFTGEHDFTSFANPASQTLLTGGSAVRRVESVSVNGETICGTRAVRFKVTGNGFLYNMVRIMAGSLMNVGQGLKSPDWIGEALILCDRTRAGTTAEARGLCLMGIKYI